MLRGGELVLETADSASALLEIAVKNRGVWCRVMDSTDGIVIVLEESASECRALILRLHHFGLTIDRGNTFGRLDQIVSFGI
jgi:hypothetical protein